MATRHLPGCTGHPPTWGCDACRDAAHASPPDVRSLRRARTADQRASLAAGIHPATGTAVDHDHICGACDHFLIQRHAGAPAWFKCELHRYGTMGADTDIRQGWPACARFSQSVEIPVTLTSTRS